ncbi:hypothetical protein [Bradyrhizobium sp. BR 1433]|uniref:hypothetical protein n=1 Tax=Bradyrhizobium sp. BR 1433 TaxID=3447967 RepID=UPI003EE6B05A
MLALEKKPMSFHVWVKSGGFNDFPDAKLPEDKPPPPVRRFMQGDELAGLAVAVRMAERRDLKTVTDQQLGVGLWTIAVVQPDLVALAEFVGDAIEDWQFVEEGGPQFAAWRDRLQLWMRVEVRAERIWSEPFDPAVHGLPAIHPDFRLRKAKHGLRVPRPFPPRRDGTWRRAGESE